MDTFGSLVDKLATVNNKMFVNQELIYEIRRMTFAEFCKRYLRNKKNAKKLFIGLQKCCDLNVQRNALIDEVDEFIAKALKLPDDGRFIQRKQKTY